MELGLLLGGIVAVVVGMLLWRQRPAKDVEREAPVQVLEPTSAGPVPVEEAPQGGGTGAVWKGLGKTRQEMGRRLAALFSRQSIDDALFDGMEEVLIAADVGVRTSRKVVARVKEASEGVESAEDLRGALEQEIHDLLAERESALNPAPEDGPYVVLVVGVNGSGKTTTIGKLAARFTDMGHKVMLGAGDTFRAGAIDQLRVWAERSNAEIVAHEEGSDPGAVLFDALDAAKARDCTVVLCDTAGRLQSKQPLMDELAKVRRVVGKAVPGAPHEVLLVLDATIGQNAISQARTFGEVAGVTGVVLTKLDGTARGGVVVAVAADLGFPVKFIGVGEQVDDLRPFEAQPFVEAMLLPEAGA